MSWLAAARQGCMELRVIRARSWIRASRRLRSISPIRTVVLDALEAGQVEVLADARTRSIKASLSRDHELIYREVQTFWNNLVAGAS
jgi:hypothetical protein